MSCYEHQCEECNNEDEYTTVYWNDGVVCGDELTHPNTRDYTALCEDCKYKLEEGETDDIHRS